MTTDLSIHLNFARSFNAMCAEVHQLAVSKGWWDQPRSIVGLITLAQSESNGEGVEALRKPGPSDKIPEFLGIEEELADTLIRLGDMFAYLDINLGARLIYFFLNAGYPEIENEVAKEQVDFREFAEHYNVWLSVVDLWPYVTSGAVKKTDDIDDLDLVGELLSTAARAKESVGYPNLFLLHLSEWVLRLIGIGQYKGWRIAEALVAKHEHNKGRSIRHGNKVY